jgi:AcrR family transcriptional regulator
MTKKNPENVKERIIRSAMELFLAKGYAGSTTAELVRLAGVSKGALYYHFKEKEDLLCSILEKYETGYVEKLIALVAESDGNFVSKFKAFYKYATEFTYYNRELLLVFIALLIEFAGSGAEIETKIKAAFERHIRSLRELLEDGVKDGSVDKKIDPLVYSRFFSGAMMGSLVLWDFYLPEYEADRDLSRRQAIAQRDALLLAVASPHSSLRSKKAKRSTAT